MVQTNETVTLEGSQQAAEEYIREHFDIKGEPIDRYAVSVPDESYGSPALSFSVEDDDIRYVHALYTGHVVIRYDRDTGRGVGPHSDQKDPSGSGSGHPR